MALVTELQAHDRLRLAFGGSPEIPVDRDLRLMMEIATALVITHIKRPDHGWTIDTDPETDSEFAIIQGAILDVLCNLFAHRGDDDAHIDGPLSQRVKDMLTMHRDPAIA